jgi:hypothetical protein
VAVAGGGPRVILCYHTRFDLWTVNTVPKISSNPDHIQHQTVGIQHAVGRNWMAINDSDPLRSPPVCVVSMEQSTADSLSYRYTDGGNPTGGVWYGIIVETANVKLDGLLGFARVWRAYVETKSKTPYTGIRVGLVIDYGSGVSSRDWTTLADIASGATASSSHWLYQVHVSQQQCSAIRLVISEQQQSDAAPDPLVPPANTYMTLVGFGLEYGQKPGTGRGAAGSKK